MITFFLLALIVVGGQLKGLVKIVTAFTVAHSITLCLAALEIVMLLLSGLKGIALSIAYVALLSGCNALNIAGCSRSYSA